MPQHNLVSSINKEEGHIDLLPIFLQKVKERVVTKKHKHDFREMSDKKCTVCDKPLKKNVVERQPNADRCYAHEKNKSGHAKRER